MDFAIILASWGGTALPSCRCWLVFVPVSVIDIVAHGYHESHYCGCVPYPGFSYDIHVFNAEDVANDFIEKLRGLQLRMLSPTCR